MGFEALVLLPRVRLLARDEQLMRALRAIVAMCVLLGVLGLALAVAYGAIVIGVSIGQMLARSL